MLDARRDLQKLAFLLGIFAGLCGAKSAKDTVVVWHTLDGRQGEFFLELVRDFNARSGQSLRAETGMELPHALIEQLGDEQGTPPDALLGPSDMIGLAELLRLSSVPDDVAGSRFGATVADSVKLSGRAYGAPVLEGNHLMLFFNRRLVKEPAATIERIAQDAEALRKSGARTIAWQFQEPYLFATFLLAFDAFPLRDQDHGPAQVDFSSRTSTMRHALELYGSLAASGLVEPSCDYECVSRGFQSGRYAYAIDGDWAVEAASTALGPDFGVAPLPKVNGRSLKSFSATHALMFPSRSLDGPKRSTLIAFAQFLQERSVQRRWHLRTRRMPVDRDAVAADERTPIERDVEAQLAPTRRMPVAKAMAFTWPALRKGLKLYLSGALSADASLFYAERLVGSALADEATP